MLGQNLNQGVIPLNQFFQSGIERGQDNESIFQSVGVSAFCRIAAQSLQLLRKGEAGKN